MRKEKCLCYFKANVRTTEDMLDPQCKCPVQYTWDNIAGDSCVLSVICSECNIFPESPVAIPGWDTGGCKLSSNSFSGILNAILVHVQVLNIIFIYCMTNYI